MTVSVVIPAYNAGRFIDDAVASVLSQDFAADEIFIINDGSADRDYQALATLDARIRVVNQANQGVSAARNRGCQLSASEYIAILDADDVWLAGKLRAQMEHLAANPSCDAVFCLGANWSPRGSQPEWPRPEQISSPVPPRPAVVTLRYSDFLLRLPVATSTMVVKRKVWLALGGFDEGRRYAEDQDFNLRLSHQYRVDLITAPAMLYRRHAGSATHKIQEANHWADVIRRAAKNLGLRDRENGDVADAQLSERLSNLHYLHGLDHFWKGSAKVARREFMLAFRARPYRPKTVVHLLAASFPGVLPLLRRVFSSRVRAGNT